MRDYVQCVIRDTARHSPARDYYLIKGARSWTVSDQMTKREIILQGTGWGHMPTFLIEQELRDGDLIAISGKHFRGATGDLVAARLRDRPHGPVAARLWRHIETEASALDMPVKTRAASRSRAPARPRGRPR